MNILQNTLRPLTFALVAFTSTTVAVSPSFARTDAVIRDRVEKSFQVKPGGVLTFDSNVGSVEVLTGDSSAVAIEIERKVSAESREEADELLKQLSLEMVQQGDGVKVVAKFPERRNDSQRPIHLAFRISIPRNYSVDLQNVGGSAAIGDLQGTAKASAIGGSLKVGNVSGPVIAKSAGGSITVGDVGGDLNAQSGGGSVRVGRVNGRVTAKAGGGSVFIESATDAIQATADGGSVRAAISRQPGSECKLVANAGSIDLRLPESAAVTLDASCTAGRINSDFSVSISGTTSSTRLQGQIGGGGPSVVLRAAAGSINVRKGTSEAANNPDARAFASTR